MKTAVRGIAIYTLSLFLLPYLIPGVQISGGFLTLLIGGTFLALLFFTLKPILSIISLPINLLTLGLFSFVVNAFILYILTIIISGISITAFEYSGINFLGFVIPRIYFNLFFTYIYTAFVLSFIDSFFSWLMS